MLSEKQPMKQIGAWVRDPKNNIFKGMSKRCALFRIYCENSDDCDLFKSDGSCLLCASMPLCRFGRKSHTEGPTPAARNFHSTMRKWREENAEYIDSLKSLKAYNRIFYTNGFYYLPYSFIRGCDGSPFPGSIMSNGAWVASDDMTAELLATICTAQPRAMFGGVIHDYQNKEVPKFISDLQHHYPHLFDMLPDEQKARVQSMSYVGREADITTCPPCEFVISDKKWKWDGEFLIGSDMLFQPVAGDLEVRIRPKNGASVKITDNNQVNDSTRFLD